MRNPVHTVAIGYQQQRCEAKREKDELFELTLRAFLKFSVD